MAPSRLSPEERERERQRYKTKLAKALTEEDDPLGVYYQFVEWTLKQYGEKDSKSGLKSLLEEATRVFKDDQVYKTDLRYLKLWSLHARQLPRVDAIDVYALLLSNNIGTDYSMLYEEYAHLLEKDGKADDANSIYCKGIERNARPRERLKNRYREFKSRSGSNSPASNNHSSPPSSSSQLQRPAPVSIISMSSTPQSRYAVMLAPPAPGKRPEKFRFNISLLFTEESGEYSIQESRAKSMGLLGKKWAPLPVNNLSLSSVSSVRDDASMDMQKLTRTGNVLRRKSLYGGGAEPTVTINTKEALADVFGMYNSPDKTRSMGLPGTKHAPLKKVDPITPITQPRFTATNENENRSRNENDPPQIFKTPTTTFRPFIDENVNANHIPQASGQSTPFVDPPANKTPSITNSRSVLSVKETSLASSSKSSNSPRPVDFASATTSSSPETVFSKVFTPAREHTPPLASPREASTDHHGKPESKLKLQTHERAQSSPAGSGVPSSSKNVHPFRPFVDNENARTPFKVFSRPPDQDQAQLASHELQTASNSSGSSNLGKENPFTPKTPVAVPDTKPPAFTPFRDERKAGTSAVASTSTFKPFIDPADKENALATPASIFVKPGHILVETQPRTVLAPSVGWPSSGVSSSSSSSFSDLAEISEHVAAPVQYDDEYDDDEYDEGDDLDQAQGIAAHPLQQHVVETDSEYEYEGESFQDAHHHHHYQDPEGIPLGGRFGQINVMTPITERTIEYTMSTHVGTPSNRFRNNGEMGKDFDDGEEEDSDFDMRELTGYQHRSELDAQRAAERLAAELQKEESSVERNQDPFSVHEGDEYPGGLSLADTLTLSSNFKPPNPCNPFDAAILSTLLSRMPLDSHFYDLRSQDSGMLDALEKFTKSASGRKSGVDLAYFSLNLNGQRFSVSEKLGEGGFGSVFKARILRAQPPDSDEDEDLEDDDDGSALAYVALKVVRPRNLWEYHILRRLHFALPPVARRSVVLPHHLYAFKDESFLVLDFCPQGTLLTTVNNAVAAGVSQQGGCLDELLVIFFSIELLRLVEAMHSVGFIHGDLKIDNCLLRLEEVPGGVSAWSSMYQPSGEGGWACKGLRIIDFGRMIDTRLFPSGQQYLAEWETDERDCFEARENKPWTYQADYFGLAGIIYCMLFGRYLQTSSIVVTQKNDKRYKIGTPLKRYWQTDLWNRVFDILLNPLLVRPENSLPLCDELGELRKDMEKWLRANCNRSSNTLKGLLKKVEMASLR